MMTLDWQVLIALVANIAADHDIDQPDVRQIRDQEVQYLVRDGPFAVARRL